MTGRHGCAGGAVVANAAAMLADAARRHPDRVAVVLGPQRLTYGQLWTEVRRYAAALADRGVRRGDVVGLLAPNVPDFPRVYFAVLALGATVLPLHAGLLAPEIAYLLRDASARLLVVAAPLWEPGGQGAARAGVEVAVTMDDVVAVADAGSGGGTGADGGSGGDTGAVVWRLDEAAAAAEPLAAAVMDAGGAAVIAHTLGTGADPKGAIHTHHTVTVAAAAVGAGLGLTGDDVVFAPLPLFHHAGRTLLDAVVAAGATMVLMARFEPGLARFVAVKERATVFAGMPAMVVSLLGALRSGDELPPLRLGLADGTALPARVRAAFARVFGAPLARCYGLAETGGIATLGGLAGDAGDGAGQDAGDDAVPGAAPGAVMDPLPVGRAVDGIELAVAEIPGAGPPASLVSLGTVALVPPGEVGEVVVRGPAVSPGYVGRVGETAAPRIDGWLRTGDLGALDGSGQLRLHGRVADRVATATAAGVVHPAALERVLAAHPGVWQAVVIGRPADGGSGGAGRAGVPGGGAGTFGGGAGSAPTLLWAVVAPDPNGLAPSEDELLAWVDEHLPEGPRPDRVRLVPDLPHGPTGVVLRRAIRL